VAFDPALDVVDWTRIRNGSKVFGHSGSLSPVAVRDKKQAALLRSP
jgi:hypothetical protein